MGALVTGWLAVRFAGAAWILLFTLVLLTVVGVWTALANLRPAAATPCIHRTTEVQRMYYDATLHQLLVLPSTRVRNMSFDEESMVVDGDPRRGSAATPRCG